MSLLYARTPGAQHTMHSTQLATTLADSGSAAFHSNRTSCLKRRRSRTCACVATHARWFPCKYNLMGTADGYRHPAPVPGILQTYDRPCEGCIQLESVKVNTVCALIGCLCPLSMYHSVHVVD